jgi:3-methyladenine DNA glycosylase AlkD
MKYRGTIHSWDQVDDSAPYIVGRYLLLYDLERSRRIWDRRIAVVATLWFIRQGQVADTLKIAEILLNDEEDLINKACRWALREVGKKRSSCLKAFPEQALPCDAQTMLRYVIERFEEDQRHKYLKGQL